MSRKRRKAKKPKKLYYLRSQADIAEIFSEMARVPGTASLGVDSEKGPILSPGLIYCPEWRELDTRGKLGEWYGPRSQTELGDEIARFHASIHGGGLWDFASDPSEIQKKVKKRIGREDFEQVKKFVEKNSGDIPIRELQVYHLYFIKEFTLKRTAMEMGHKSTNPAEDALNHLRRRVRAGDMPKPALEDSIRPRRRNVRSQS